MVACSYKCKIGPSERTSEDLFYTDRVGDTALVGYPALPYYAAGASYQVEYHAIFTVTRIHDEY